MSIPPRSPSAAPAAPAEEKPSAGFVAFYSSVPGHLVPRYGASSPAPYLGAERVVDPATKRAELKWDEAVVVPLTEREARIYRREYADHVREGALKERTAEDYDRFIGKILRTEAEDAARAKAKREAEETKAKEAAKAAAAKGSTGDPSA